MYFVEKQTNKQTNRKFKTPKFKEVLNGNLMRHDVNNCNS